MLRPFYHQGKKRRHSLVMRLGGPQTLTPPCRELNPERSPLVYLLSYNDDTIYLVKKVILSL
jgi:hypothetical protein